MMAQWTLLFLFSCVWGLSQASPRGNALLEVTSAGATEKLSICIFYNSKYQNLPSTLEMASSHRLVNLSDVDGCKAQDYNNPPSPLENSTVAVARGHCKFVHKANMVEAVKGAAALVVDLANSTSLSSPGGNASEFESINITLATITFKDFSNIASLPGPVELTMYAPVQPLWDSSMILIVVFSTAYVFIGGAWAAYDESRTRKGTRRSPSRSNSHDDSEDEGNKGKRKDDEMQISVWGILIWFIAICGMILLLYFFYGYMVYFFIAVFCIVGSYSLYQCLLPVWTWAIPITYDIPLNRLPCIKSKVKLRSFLLLMPCLTLGIFWAIERHAKFAWTIQDLLGSTFCIFFVQSFRLPNLKVIAVLLILLLIYDVFFVFITPLFTKNGESIMESVATGGSGHSTESLPMVFLVPIINDLPGRKCLDRDFALLGFGDVIIPGLLIGYNAIFDVKTGNRMTYFLFSCLGYFVGMIICMISLVYMNSGQPALLYLVPGVLISTVAVALVRRELGKLFFGKHLQKVETMDSIESQDKETDEIDVSNDPASEEERNLIN